MKGAVSPEDRSVLVRNFGDESSRIEIVQADTRPGWIQASAAKEINLDVVFAAALMNAENRRAGKAAQGCSGSRFRLFLPSSAASASAHGRHSLSFVSELAHTSGTGTLFIIPTLAQLHIGCHSLSSSHTCHQ